MGEDISATIISQYNLQYWVFNLNTSPMLQMFYC